MKRFLFLIAGLVLCGSTAWGAESSISLNRRSETFKQSGQLVWMALTNPALGDTNDVYKTGQYASGGAVAETHTFTAAERAVFTAACECNSARARNVTLTLSGTAANIDGAVDPTVTGINLMGESVTETFDATENTAGTLTGALCFKDITSLTFPAQDGTNVSLAVGFGNKFGAPITMWVGGGTTAGGQVLLTNCNGSTNEGGTWTVDDDEIEKNGFTPTTACNGSIDWKFLLIASPYATDATATRGW